MEKKKGRKRIKHTEAYKLKHRQARLKKSEGSNPLVVSLGMAAAIEQSLVDEVNSRAVEAPAPAPASKPASFLWLAVLLVILVLGLVGGVVAKIYLG
jgi:hypothetical protein